jgi:hypothetical protein
MNYLKAIGMLALLGVTLLVLLATPLVLIFIWFAEATPHEGGIDAFFYWVLIAPWTALASIWGLIFLNRKKSN